jgi:hypothetical protein
VEDRPDALNAPWHPFPLIELSVLIGIICIAVGFFTRDATHGRILIALGVVLASLAGLDTSAREHFAGYRSHTLVLAAFPAVGAAAIAGMAKVPVVLIVPIMFGVFLAAFVGLRRVWEAKTRVPA